MGGVYRDDGMLLVWFLVFLTLAFVALIVACIRGRRWGDLSSRRNNGEALSGEEVKTLKCSRRSFCIWLGISLLLAALAFFLLRE